MVEYELIEHTADIGIRLKAKDLEDLFRKAALAMFDIIAEKKSPVSSPRSPANFNLSADNLDELFVNWLNDLLSLSAAKDLIFCDFKIDKLDESGLSASAVGEAVKNYKINTEIKAATYHELKLEKVKSGWQAQGIFDV